MKIHSYVVEHDFGFAPNPFYGVCTLAACKPVIRRCAQIGDYLVGTGCAKNRRSGYLVYYMRVDEILTYDGYWNDPRFQRKKPFLRGSRKQAYGDNIYRTDPLTGLWKQADSFHSMPHGRPNQANLVHDTQCSNVLLGREFAYWGKSAKPIPLNFRDWGGEDICHNSQGHKNKFSDELVRAFIAWLQGLAQNGCLGDPFDWVVMTRQTTFDFGL